MERRKVVVELITDDNGELHTIIKSHKGTKNGDYFLASAALLDKIIVCTEEHNPNIVNDEVFKYVEEIVETLTALGHYVNECIKKEIEE